MKFWAVLGRRGSREKQIPTAINMQLFGVVFSTFFGKKINILIKTFVTHYKAKKHIEKFLKK